MRVFGNLALGLLFGLAALDAGCNPNPYCLNCNARDLGSDALSSLQDFGQPDLAGDMAEAPMADLAIISLDMCSATPMQLQVDPNNCGKCGNKCSYANAQGLCVEGACAMGDCLPGFYDVDKSPVDGCEYQCFPTPPTACQAAKDCTFGLPCTNGLCTQPCQKDGDCPKKTVCDPATKACEGDICDGKDNNCNGLTDETFDLLHDTANCGECNYKCAPDSTCTPMAVQGGPDGGVGMIGSCHLMCPACKADIDGNPANGCEYTCPVCPPTKEICNGIDDDCDGLVDDNVTDVGQPCDQACPALAPCVGQKNCQFKVSPCIGKCCGICTQGSTICVGGQKLCQAGTGPKLEVCNGIDDNCDGQIDEGFDLQNDPVNCGACGKVCSLPNAVAGCKVGQCSILSCKPGFADVNKDPKDGCEYSCPVNPPTVETCNGKDDDCDGIIDDNLTPPPKNFCNQVGPCAGTSTTCKGVAGWFCEYGKNNPRIELDMSGNIALVEKLCDNFDGNCNGFTDESFVNKGKPCTAGVGACLATANFVCSKDLSTTVCPTMGNPSAATDEVCNGLDDNCDGQTDERNPANNAQCFNGGQHACKALVEPMVKVSGNVYMYPYEASRPDATNGAIGSANNRACAKAGVMPWAPVTWSQAAAACSAITDSQGKPMRLCDAVTEWTPACANGSNANPIWSYAVHPTTYSAGTCNGSDANVGAAWPTATGGNCYSPVGGGKVYDLSGNVAEWTNSTVVTNGSTYYKVRGGAYNNFATGINCDFDFTIELPSYQYNDLGFRCCADNAP